MISEQLERVSPWLIGLWRFRTASEDSPGEHPRWCVTFRYRGLYYDTVPQPTPDAALTEALTRIHLLEDRHGPCPLARSHGEGAKFLSNLELDEMLGIERDDDI